MSGGIKKCSVEDLERALGDARNCQVVDVREKPEVFSESVVGALNVPLSSLEENIGSLEPSRAVYLLCRAGVRSKDAANLLERKGFKDIYILEGGLKEWIEAGKPVIRQRKGVWELERQVRFAAGTLVLLGIGFSVVAHPYFLLLSAVVGAGLVFSALTNTCGMAILLVKMPWNNGKKTSHCCR